jgi:D-proline reductase (dithiol) PrdB
VGLVQREIETAGFSTISLSLMPEVTASAGAPRVAAIEHPFGMTLGRPGDAAGQLAVLRAALLAMEAMAEPGTVVHLPFRWTSTEKPVLHPPVTPPIGRYLASHPWALPRFLNRTPPESPG